MGLSRWMIPKKVLRWIIDLTAIQPMAEMAHRVHCSRHVMQMPSYKSNKATPIPLSSAQCSSIHTAAAAAAGLLYNGCTLLKELNGRPSILQQYNHVRRDPARPTDWLGLLAAVASPLTLSMGDNLSSSQCAFIMPLKISATTSFVFTHQESHSRMCPPAFWRGGERESLLLFILPTPYDLQSSINQTWGMCAS